MRTCEICNKNEKEIKIVYFKYKQYLCSKHYSQMLRYGEILERTKFDSNEVINCGNYYEICIYSHKNKEVARTKVDKGDIGKVKKYKWSLRDASCKYAVTTISGKMISLHKLLLGNKNGLVVDHIDNDGLNNTRKNLRFATISQNGTNSKKSIGIYWDGKRGRWVASLYKNGKNYYLGCSSKKMEALRMRKAGEVKYFGEFRNKKK